MNLIAIILSFVFGTFIGSFLNVLIWRLPREESIGGRSHCPKCGHKLIWLDLLPIISILLFGAKCRYCKRRISLRYPLIEITTGLLFALVWYQFTPLDLASSGDLIKGLIVVAVCIAVFVIDLEHYLILDKIVFPAAILMAILAIANHSYGNLLAGLFGFIPFWLIWLFSKGKWMGLGDAKFVAFMGLTLGFSSLIVALFFAFNLGAIVGVILILAGKKDLSGRLPFGTFLTVSMVLALFYGQKLWDLYWTLL